MPASLATALETQLLSSPRLLKVSNSGHTRVSSAAWLAQSLAHFHKCHEQQSPDICSKVVHQALLSAAIQKLMLQCMDVHRNGRQSSAHKACLSALSSSEIPDCPSKLCLHKTSEDCGAMHQVLDAWIIGASSQIHSGCLRVLPLEQILCIPLLPLSLGMSSMSTCMHLLNISLVIVS